jgi:hypothetical protein
VASAAAIAAAIQNHLPIIPPKLRLYALLWHSRTARRMPAGADHNALAPC